MSSAFSSLGVQGPAGSDTLQRVAASGASQAVDFSAADVWDITLSAACTLSLTGFTNSEADFLTLILRQDGTGGRVVTWPTITWIGSGVAPTLQTAAGAVDSVVLFSFDGGTTVFGIAQTSASGIAAGTSFPVSPADGDLFYRTDRRIEYEYNATVSKWLSLDRKYVPFTQSRFVNATGSVGVWGWIPIPEDVYIESCIAHFHLGATNNGSNFWTATFNKLTASGSTSTTIATANSSTDAATGDAVHTTSVAAVLAAATYGALLVSISKTGTPATGDFSFMAIVRSVG